MSLQWVVDAVPSLVVPVPEEDPLALCATQGVLVTLVVDLCLADELLQRRPLARPPSLSPLVSFQTVQVVLDGGPARLPPRPDPLPRGSIIPFYKKYLIKYSSFLLF